jgi:ECF transporter S component (folate family)
MQTNNRKISLSAMLTIALLMALDVILTRLLSINTPVLRISLGFVPVALMAAAYGPLWTGAACVIDDIVGATLFPTASFFPGFTLTAFLTGFTFGAFLHRKPVTWRRVLPAAAIVCLFCNLCLDSLWLYLMMGKGFLALIPMRIAKAALMLPAETVLIPPVWRYVGRFMPASRGAENKTGGTAS